ncbi:MFS transporter [Rhodococcus sp. NCIMB 12038]|uniref:MFS transporter n=1 Tax=Rhodococcus sp. NCIMB 12038 TaxID=933800 RepID=UPI000B3CCE91|nr:MFS transporter [Rhodococcus sp. NCIMB 12038]OUS91362.1 hypothetical protein CA951_33450 [Rhodococcus sp. NCIMB 12038]
MTSSTASGAEITAPPRTTVGKVAAASLAGTAIEYYDFAIYGLAAALVFPQLFFAGSSPVVGTLASFGTFAVGFIARPLGGILFGHFGDRIGRKPMLVITLVLMGVCSTAIGLLPTHEQVGVWAPVLLVLLRITQGIAFGGEWGGAVLMAFEYSPPNRRGFFAAVPQVGPTVGALAGNGVFALVALLPEEQMLSWGWRIPFLFSAVLVVIGIFVRSRIAESPDFLEVKNDGVEARVPLLEVIRNDMSRVLLVVAGYFGFGAFAAVGISWMVKYGTGTVGVAPSSLLATMMMANVIQVPVLLVSGSLADRWGHRKLFLVGPPLAAIGIFVLFAGVNTGIPLGVFVGYAVGQAIFYGISFGALPSLFADAFDSRVRYTGMSLGYQLGNVVGTGLTPLIATLLLDATGSGYAVATYVAVTIGISMLALLRLTSIVTAGTAGPVVAPDRTADLESAPPAM